MDNAPASTNPTEEKYPWRGHWLLIVTYCGLGLFFWLPHSYMRMVGWPWLLVWQLGFLAAGVLGIWMLRQSNKSFLTLGYGLDWVLGLFAISILISIAVAPVTQLAGWYGAMASGYGGLLYVLRNWIGHKTAYLQRLWLGIVAIGLGTNLISLAMWRPTAEMWRSADFYEAVRNAMPLGHHNFVGGFEVLMLPLAITFALAWGGWQRWLGIVASILALVALYASGSRGAMVGAIVIALCAAIALVTRFRGKRRLTIVSLAILSFLGVLALSFTNPRVQSLVSQLLRSPASQANLGQTLLTDGPIMDRWQMLLTADNIFQAKPLTGVGLGNMVRVSNLYRPSWSYLDHIQQLHNTPVQLLGELGLVGVLALLAACGFCGWLWYRLSRQALSNQDFWLLTGAGISLLAYGVSSLTDYQLENIPIAALILFNVTALVCLGTQYGLGSPFSPLALPLKARRILSLLSLVWLGLVLRIWLPVDLAAQLQGSAYQALAAENAVQADANFDRASRLTPWDPIPSVLAAHNLTSLSQGVGPEDQKALREQAIVYYQRAVATAPNDAWFNYNLANLLLPLDPQQAETHAGRSVQLSPRETNYNYFLLGLAYFLQNKIPQAVDAFALETLVDPQSISMTAWQVPPLSAMTEDVTQTSAELYDQLVAQMDLTHPTHQMVYEQGLLVRWWHGLPLPDYEEKALRPVVRALFLAEAEPEAALALLNQRVETDKANTSELLLRAWLKPGDYLGDYLEAADLPPQEVAAVSQNIRQNRDLRTWLNGETTAPARQARGSLGFAYRNRYANRAEELFQPEGIRLSQTAIRLDLFREMPRVLRPLDELINEYRAEQLNLPHPTQSDFRLVEPAAWGK